MGFGAHNKTPDLKYSNNTKPSLAEVVGEGKSEMINMIQATAPHIKGCAGVIIPWEDPLNPVVHAASGKGEA